jgi:thiol-disulfide isomerase/thioredoxin
MSLSRRDLLFGFAAICGAGAGIWASLRSYQASDTANLAPFWAARLKDLNGSTIAMESLRGKPLIINFWATWCEPCKEEMPDFQRFAAGPDGKKAQIVGIGIDSASNMLAFSNKLGISYLLVEGGAAGLDMLTAAGDKPRALPFTVILDASGQAVFRKIGKVDHAELSLAVSRL